MGTAKRRVAVVGAGAGGLGAAWALQSAADVTVIHAQDEAGGNAHSHLVPSRRGGTWVDMGFMLSSQWSYPNLYCLFGQLAVETFPLQVSLGASFGEGNAWITGGMQNTPFWQGVSMDIITFEQRLFAALNDKKQWLLPLKTLTKGLSDNFTYKVLSPLLSLFVVTRTGLLEEPIAYAGALATSLSFVGPTTWNLIKGASRTYVRRTIESLKQTSRVIADTRVTRVTQQGNQVHVVGETGHQKKPYSGVFDDVILAIEANRALEIVGDATPREKELLSKFEYEPATVYLHQDMSILAPNLPKTAITQYRGSVSGTGDLEGIMTYNVGLGFGVPRALVSVYSPSSSEPRPNNVLATKHWQHVKITTAALGARSLLHEIQGVRGLWYASAYTTYATHEAAFGSGLCAAERLAQVRGLGSVYPYPNQALALQSFRSLWSTMFPTAPPPTELSAEQAPSYNPQTRWVR